jgi:putative transposase
MWKPEHRRAACRRGLRYPSDLTECEWALVEPLIPPAKRGGRRRTIDVREVLNAIFYVLSTGCQWNALPKDLPPKSMVYDYLDLWDWDGTLERIHHALYVATREQAGREASPSVAIIDAQSAKGAVKRGASLDPSGYDAGKKVTGRKRHILVDIFGFLLSVVVHPADVQDRDGAVAVLRQVLPIHRAQVATKGRKWPRRLPKLVHGGWRSSSAAISIALLSCPNAGSSNEPSPGLATAVVSPRTSSVMLAKPLLSSASP